MDLVTTGGDDRFLRSFESHEQNGPTTHWTHIARCSIVVVHGISEEAASLNVDRPDHVVIVTRRGFPTGGGKR
jgi:hypothetical protein